MPRIEFQSPILYTQQNKSLCYIDNIAEYIEPVVVEKIPEVVQEVIPEKVVDPLIQKFDIVWNKYLKEE